VTETRREATAATGIDRPKVFAGNCLELEDLLELRELLRRRARVLSGSFA
jgi:hypothetical protein